VPFYKHPINGCNLIKWGRKEGGREGKREEGGGEREKETKFKNGMQLEAWLKCREPA
jgi:hypothetical protein